jgi:Protein of unknown function (DUF4238)
MELQHFVSKFIIKNWVQNDGRVILHCKDDFHSTLHQLKRSPALVFCWPDLYTIKATNKDRTFERYLEHDAAGEIERRASSLINELASSSFVKFQFINNPLSQKTIRQFIRLHFIRHPENIKHSLIRYQESIVQRGLTPSDFGHAGIQIESGDDVIRYVIANVILRTEALERLGEATYIYFRVNPESSERLILGDHLILPHFQLTPNNINYMQGVIAIPISPTSAILITTNEYYTQHVLKLSEKRIVHGINQRVLQKAQYGVIESSALTSKFIKKYFNPSFYFSFKTKTYISL